MTAAMTAPYDPVAQVVDALREAGCHVQSAGRDRYNAQCPAHDDRDPSLSVARGSDKVLLYCHAGCGISDILASLDLSPRQMFNDYTATTSKVTPIHHLRAWKTPEERQQRPKPRPWTRAKVCHYDYVWPDGSPAMRVVRYNKVDKETGEVTGKKTFTQHAWDPEAGKYAPDLGDMNPPIYHADRVAATIAMNLPVIVCEGEKDADAVTETFKLTATCNPMGAGAWRPQHTEALRGASVVIIADDDQAGLQHAQEVYDALVDVAADVRVTLPAEGFKDISEHIAAGHGLDELRSPQAEPEHTTWWPVDIGAILTGDADDTPQPTHLLRDDGKALFYPGRVNGIIGESESGKTWVALLAVKQALQLGQRVLYLDFEDTAAGIIGRLKAMSVGLHNLTTFAYVAPDEQLHADAMSDFNTLIAAGYDLVVVDGFNAAMTLLGLDINSNNDATTFVQNVLKPIAAKGSTVIYIDHVPKNKDARGKGGIGAQAKRAMTTGCALTVEVAQPFGAGQHGKLHLKVDKDRPGKVRAISAESKFAGTVSIDSIDDIVDIQIQAPVDSSGHGFRPTKVMAQISHLLEGGESLNQNAIEAQVGGRPVTVQKALQCLLQDGHITFEHGPRNSLIYTLTTPFTVEEDQ